MNSIQLQNKTLICISHASKRTVISNTESGEKKPQESLIRKKKYNAHYNEIVTKGKKCKPLKFIKAILIPLCVLRYYS